MKPSPDPHYRHRFPAEIISHAVWLYHVFNLSLRDVELLLAERGVVVSYESIRRWCGKFGGSFASSMRRRRPRPGDKWYLDEVFIRIQGELHYLWRAVDQDGVVLDILVQSRRDAKAAKRFFKRLLWDLQYVPLTSPILRFRERACCASKRQLLSRGPKHAGRPRTLGRQNRSRIPARSGGGAQIFEITPSPGGISPLQRITVGQAIRCHLPKVSKAAPASIRLRSAS
jgi:putative transposase